MLVTLSVVAADAKKDSSASDADRLQGIWKVEAMESRKLGPAKEGDRTDIDEPVVLRIAGDEFRMTGGAQPDLGKYSLDPDTPIPQIDVELAGGETAIGIYKLEEDRLTICWAEQGAPRPEDFGSGKGLRLMSFRKAPLLTSESLSDAWKKVKDYKFDRKGDLIVATEQRLDQLDPMVTKFRAKLGGLKLDAKEEAELVLKQLDQDRTRIREQIASAREADELSWSNVKYGIGKAIRDLDASYESAKEYFANIREPKRQKR
jgi:uncharacterized protein (TIGR03067 family)